MATYFTGTTLYFGYQNQTNLRVNAWYEGDPNSGSVTVKGYYEIWTKYDIDDSQTLSWKIGGTTGSKTFENKTTGGTVGIGTFSASVSTSYTSTTKVTLSGSISGHWAGISPSVSGSIYIPRRLYSAPAAPTSVAAARVNDTQHTITWTNGASTTGAPRQLTRIQRWDNITGAYYTITTVGSTAQSYTDTSTTADRRYRYRVRAENTDAVSAYVECDYFATTPAAPTQVEAAKLPSGDINVAWVNTATYQTGVKVWHAADGVWDGSPIAVLGAEATDWPHPSPNASVTHAYRVTAVADGPSEDLESAYSATSNTIQLLTNPNPPSDLSPATARDAADAIVFAWQHNPVDSTAQTAFEIEYRAVGSPTWISTGKTTSTTSSWTMAAGTLANGASYEWHVRTWGQYADPSAWSDVATFGTSARPTATITSPGTTVALSELGLEWVFYDAEGTPQAQWNARLYTTDPDDPLENLYGLTETSTAFETYLVNGATYTVAVRVQDADGVWSLWDTVTFTVAYATPPKPTATPTWNIENGALVLTIDNPPLSEGEVAAISNDVYRNDGDGWLRIATAVPPNGSVTDYLPRPGVVNSYRIVTFSDLPSSVESDVQEIEAGPALGHAWLNAGPGFGTAIRLRGNLSYSGTFSRQKALHTFAGREYPLETAGEARSRTISLSGRIGPDTSTVEEIEDFADLPAPACYRDAAGRKWFVSVGPVGANHRKLTQDVDLSLTRISFRESSLTNYYS